MRAAWCVLVVGLMSGVASQVQAGGAGWGVGYGVGYHAPCATCAPAPVASGCGCATGDCCEFPPSWTYHVWNSYPLERRMWLHAGDRIGCRRCR